MIAVAKRLINRDEYYKMAEVGILKPEDRVELINGEIIEMSPIGSRHAGAVRKITRVLHEYLNESFDISIQSPIVLGSNTEPEPDIAILKHRADDYSSAHPTGIDVVHVIEVADTSLSYDTDVKSELYAKAGIPAYWVADLQRLEITAYAKTSNGKYQDVSVLGVGDQIDFLGIEIEVSSLLIH